MIRAGTSGYSYPEWKGHFYPKGLSPKQMLVHYASKLGTVEINNTFYKRPTKELLEGWAKQTPLTFRFAFKASRYFSAGTGLRDDKAIAGFFELVAAVGPRLGPVLVQLPAHIKKDVPLLRGFLAATGKHRVALDLVDPSWRSDDVQALVRERDAAISVTEDDETPAPPLGSGRWAYVRLRKARYDRRAIATWAARLEGFEEAYVFFKHETTGPAHALALQLAGQGSSTIS